MGTKSLIAIKKRRQTCQQQSKQEQEKESAASTFNEESPQDELEKEKDRKAEAYVRENFVIWQYNQWDGQFDGQGYRIFEFLRKFLDEWSDEKRQAYIDNLDCIRDFSFTDANLDLIQSWHMRYMLNPLTLVGPPSINLSDPEFLEYMPASRECGYQIFDILDVKKGQVKTRFISPDWPLNACDCWYGYIVDFDESEFHVLVDKPKTKASSCKLLEPLEEIYGKRGIVLSTTFKFSELPRTADEFVEIVTKNADDLSKDESKKDSDDKNDSADSTEDDTTNTSEAAGDCDVTRVELDTSI